MSRATSTPFLISRAPLPYCTRRACERAVRRFGRAQDHLPRRPVPGVQGRPPARGAGARRTEAAGTRSAALVSGGRLRLRRELGPLEPQTQVRHKSQSAREASKARRSLSLGGAHRQERGRGRKLSSSSILSGRLAWNRTRGVGTGRHGTLIGNLRAKVPSAQRRTGGPVRCHG